eukprot:scaffold3700_cov134-Pinguiococcus_pyrenoidosus.AAC.1
MSSASGTPSTSLKNSSEAAWTPTANAAPLASRQSTCSSVSNETEAMALWSTVTASSPLGL